MRCKRVALAVIAGVLAVAGACVVGYFCEDKAVPEAMSQPKPVPSPVKQAKAAPSVQTVRSSRSVQLSPEEVKRRAEREARAREEKIEKRRQEALPDELRYKHRPKLPKHLQQRIDAERELRHIRLEEKRHPERAEELKKRREELEKRLAELMPGRKAAKREKISEVPKNVSEQIKENKQ